MQKTEITNLVWFRNDLRTNDNMVLYEATKHNANGHWRILLRPKTV
jgi:deoxyribodipyrimidine photolyase